MTNYNIPTVVVVVAGLRCALQGEEGAHEDDEGILVQEAIHGFLVHGAVDAHQEQVRIRRPGSDALCNR